MLFGKKKRIKKVKALLHAHALSVFTLISVKGHNLLLSETGRDYEPDIPKTASFGFAVAQYSLILKETSLSQEDLGIISSEVGADFLGEIFGPTGNRAENTINKGTSMSLALHLDILNALINRSSIRHPIHIENLVRA